MAYSDWQDHIDHTDGGPYEDHFDHTDSDCQYTDWGDHDDAIHGDHNDHVDGGAHVDWDDHDDTGDPHEDWLDAHVDWTDHLDTGIPHTDWTDTHTNWDDHADEDYADWDDHDDGYSDHDDAGSHTDWSNIHTDDWDDHGDEPYVDEHVDWGDHDDDAWSNWGNHSNWTDYSDGHSDHDDGAHADWTNIGAYQDWDDHSDNPWYDEHTDAGHTDTHWDWWDAHPEDYLDWTDSHYDGYVDWSNVHSDSWTDHDDVPWFDEHTNWTDHDDGYTDWTDGAHQDYSDSHSDHGDHDDSPHNDWSNVHSDDWDDHGDEPYVDEHTDWDDFGHNDSHQDWDDHDDDTYSDWDDHADVGGGAHDDWTDGAHTDWDDHADIDHLDWTDAYTDYSDHDDGGAHVDWDNHADGGHTDHDDGHLDSGVPAGKTRVTASIGGYDVSCYIISADIWRDVLSCIGRWELVLDNQTHWWGGAFTVDDDIVIRINGVLMMLGYVDDIFPYIDSKGEYTEYIRVNGRDYGMDLDQLYYTAQFENRRADDMVDVVLGPAPGVNSEITYATLGAANFLDYEWDRTTLSDGIRDITKLVNYGSYVQDNVQRTLHFFPVGDPAEHTAVILQSIAGAAANNILRLDIGEDVGFDVKNHIEAHAGELNDHYTDLNGVADWAFPIGVAITDETVLQVAGKGAITMTSTAPGTNLYMTLTFPRYNHASLNMSEPNVGRYAAYPHYAAAPNYPIRLRLRDVNGDWIEYYSITVFGQPPPHETTDNTRNAEWRYIEFPYGDGTTIIAAALPLSHRAWRYIAPSVAFDWSQVDRIRFTASPLLMRANNDYCIIDELKIPAVEAISIQQNVPSIANYGTRMKDFYRPDIRSQVELDVYAVDQLAKYQNPIQNVRITAIGQVDSEYAAQSLEVHCPSSGIMVSTVYRILKLHHSVKLSPMQNEIMGYDFITEYELIRHEREGIEQYIDPDRAIGSTNPTEYLMRKHRDELRRIKSTSKIR